MDELATPIFLGIDMVGLLAIPVILVLFAFAVWWGCTRCEVGIDEEEAARRRAEVGEGAAVGAGAGK